MSILNNDQNEDVYRDGDARGYGVSDGYGDQYGSFEDASTIGMDNGSSGIGHDIGFITGSSHSPNDHDT